MKSLGLFLFLFLLTLVAWATDPLPAARTPGGRGNWQGIAGVAGGIPNRTTIFTNFSSGATSAQIQAAVSSCPSNQVVKLGDGTFTISGSWTITDSGVSIRGNGPSNTTLSVGGLTFGSFTPWNNLDSSAANVTNVPRSGIVGGLTQGSTNITITNATGFAAGYLIFIDQLNDTNSTIVSTESGGGTERQYYTRAYPTSGFDRAQRQLTKIHSISGTNITLADPIYLPSWDTNLSPTAWVFPSYTPTEMTGLEDLKIDCRTQFHCVYNCWLTNVVVETSVADVGSTDLGWVSMYYSARLAFQRIKIFGTAGAEDGYGFEPRACAAVLLENSIIDGPSVPIQFSGCYGSVFAYNWTTNVISGSGFMSQGIINHGGFPTMNLIEGNYCNSFACDNTDGPSGYNVAARNWLKGIDERRVATDNIEAVWIGGTNRNCALIGNVLGTVGVTYAAYDDTNCVANDGGSGTGKRIMGIGHWVAECGTIDPYVTATLIKAYNYNQYSSNVIADGFVVGDIPASYYLASKPSWFGNLTYPAVNPDNAIYSRSLTNFPAGYRAILGTDPPAESSSSGNRSATVSGTFRAY